MMDVNDHSDQLCEDESRRSQAAAKERLRLNSFNRALLELQIVLPIRLPVGRRLHKKKILELAISYINFLQECLMGAKQYEDRHRFMWKSGSEEADFLNTIDSVPHQLFGDSINSSPVTSSDKPSGTLPQAREDTQVHSRSKPTCTGGSKDMLICDASHRYHTRNVTSDYVEKYLMKAFVFSEKLPVLSDEYVAGYLAKLTKDSLCPVDRRINGLNLSLFDLPQFEFDSAYESESPK